jgi:hypothetical protein
MFRLQPLKMIKLTEDFTQVVYLIHGLKKGH